MKALSVLALIAVGLTAMGVTGCGGGGHHRDKVVVVRDPGPPPVYAEPTYVVVRQPPPPPPKVVVVRPAARPGPDYIWIEGYHHWDGRRYVERQGHWEKMPRAKAVWVPAHYDKVGGEWRYRPGYWK